MWFFIRYYGVWVSWVMDLFVCFLVKPPPNVQKSPPAIFFFLIFFCRTVFTCTLTARKSQAWPRLRFVVRLDRNRGKIVRSNPCVLQFPSKFYSCTFLPSHIYIYTFFFLHLPDSSRKQQQQQRFKISRQAQKQNRDEAQRKHTPTKTKAKTRRIGERTMATS